MTEKLQVHEEGCGDPFDDGVVEIADVSPRREERGGLFQYRRPRHAADVLGHLTCAILLSCVNRRVSPRSHSIVVVFYAAAYTVVRSFGRTEDSTTPIGRRHERNVSAHQTEGLT